MKTLSVTGAYYKVQKTLTNGSQVIAKDGRKIDISCLEGEIEVPVWDKIDKWLPSRDDHQDFWWKVTGRQLANMLQKAEYPLHRQYECLLFHYYVIVPRMGPQPSPSGTPPWNSFMTDDFSPVEYSWKWGLGDERPEIRFSLEPIGPYAGTAVDPYNQASVKELLFQMNAAIPGVDITWFDRFARDFQPRETDQAFESEWGSSMFTAFEFSENDIGVKAYYMPRSPSRSEEFLSSGFRKAVQSVGGNNKCLDAFEVLLDFLKNDPDGSKLQMLILGIDCVEPIKSRVKVYMRTPGTSLAHVAAIMSLGGRKKLSPEALQDMKELWGATLGLDESFSSSAELPANSHYTSGVLFYFDIKPGCSVPGVKVYIPVRHYGKDDGSIASGLTTFLEKRGRGRFSKKYMSMLRGFAEQPAIESGNGLHTYISFSFQKQGELTLTSYLSPQVYKKLTEAKKGQ